MHTTLLARIGASNRTSASGQDRPVKVGVPNGCSAISRTVMSSDSPSMETNATPSGLAIRPRRIYVTLLIATPDPHGRARGRFGRRADRAVRACLDADGLARQCTQRGPTLGDRRDLIAGDGERGCLLPL